MSLFFFVSLYLLFLLSVLAVSMTQAVVNLGFSRLLTLSLCSCVVAPILLIGLFDLVLTSTQPC